MDAAATLSRVEAALRRHGQTLPEKVAPIVYVDDFGARGDGVTDDTLAIRSALSSMQGGGTLVLSPGKTYVKSDLLVVGEPGVRIWGYGAVLYSIVTDAQMKDKGAARVAIILTAPRTALYGLTVVSNVRARPVGHPHLTGVWMASEDQQVIDNRFEYAGIFARTANNFVIARNVVYRSVSDGIHVTTGSSRGSIVANLVRETGDDMIAVVNYGLGEPNIFDFVIEGNDVAAQYWGRGISVVGGRNVLITNNRIARTSFGAGILVHSEVSYKTANVRNVRIENNQIREVATLAPPYNPAGRWKKAGHGAIDVYGQRSQQVSGVSIVGNSIDNTWFDGIFLRGNVCDVSVKDNRLTGIRRVPIRIAIKEAPECRTLCESNAFASDRPSSSRCSVQ